MHPLGIRRSPVATLQHTRQTVRMHAAEPRYAVVRPIPPRGAQRHRAAARLDGPAGLATARIGFVWDYMFRGEEIFPVIADELRRRYPTVDIIGYDTFGNVHGPDEASVVEALPGLLDEHGIDAVVVGNGC